MFFPAECRSWLTGMCLALVTASASFGGCFAAYAPRERTVRAGDVGPERTKLTGYFMSHGGGRGTWREETSAPPQVPASALADEAVISRWDRDGFCFDLTVRSAAADDVPMTAHDVKIDDEPASVGDELVTVVDHPFTGTRTVLRVEAVSGSRYTEMRLEAPEEKTFRVVERRARVCGQSSSGSEGPRLLVRRHAENKWLAFQWNAAGS